MKPLQNKAKHSVRPAIRYAIRRITPLIWVSLGLCLLVAAAFTVALWAGLVAAGVACLVMEWRVRE